MDLVTPIVPFPKDEALEMILVVCSYLHPKDIAVSPKILVSLDVKIFCLYFGSNKKNFLIIAIAL